MAEAVESALAHLSDLQQQQLSIIRLGEPLFAPDKQSSNDAKRNSDASSTDASQTPTPASLEADLAQYKDLFTKLRFSYVEQVTKEKFLRAVVGEPPLYVTQTENAALEAQLLDTKASLKAQKAEVAELISELEQRGRDLSRRYQSVQLQREQLQTLPVEIEGLKETIERLKAEQGRDGDDPAMSLPLAGTLEVLSQREEELAALNEELAQLDEAAARKETELNRLESELQILNKQKANAVAAANEARSRKEEGTGGGDELERTGRWLQSVETTMKCLLEVEG